MAVAIAVIALAGLALLAGCGGGEPGQEAGAQSEDTQAAESATPGVLPSPSPTPSPTPTATSTPTATPTLTPAPTLTPEPTPTPTPSPTEPPAAAPQAVATPGGGGGLTIWADGDSVSYFVTVAAFNRISAAGGTPVRGADYKISSGLTNPVFFDWYSYVVSEMAAYDPEIVVFMVGANDWGTTDYGAYGALAGQVMDAFAGRQVAWVGLPGFTPEYMQNTQNLNAVVAQQASQRGWVTYVDTSDLVADGPDGIHLSAGLGDLIAARALAALGY